MGKVTTETFDSLAEFVDYASGKPSIEGRYCESRKGSKSFTGTASFDEAVTLAFGWKEGIEKFADMRVKFAPKGQKMRREVQMREAGPGVLNMGNYLAGHPQPYAVNVDSQQAARGKGKIVRLEVSLFVSGGTSNDAIERRGGAVTALADALEKAGRRVEIYGNICVSNGTRSGAPRLNFRIRIKAAHEKMSLPTVAFVMGHPSLYRRLGFAALEVHPKGTDFGAFNYYGYTAEPDAVPGAVKVPSLHLGTFMSNPNTEKWVRDTLEAEGVSLA